ncbi:hypothetical protein ZWY2020_035712 [Hordeum vulgare]|nr:hypothetical protein ZWY2020_035712 [Hordeum vulgare]
MEAANAKRARAVYRTTEITLDRVEAIQDNIKNIHVKIPQASLESSMHHTSEEEEVEKCKSIKEFVVEYQQELCGRHYYQYYNDEDDADGKDAIVVEFSLGDTESTSDGMLPGQVAVI